MRVPQEVLGRGTVRSRGGRPPGMGPYIGEDGGFVGMSGFGASGAETDLYDTSASRRAMEEVVETARGAEPRRRPRVPISKFTSPSIGRARIG